MSGETLLSKIKKCSPENTVNNNIYVLHDPTNVGTTWNSEVEVVNTKKNKINIHKLKSLEEFANKVTDKSLKKGSRKRKHSESEKHTDFNESFVRAALERSQEDEVFFSKKGLITLIESKLISQRLFDIFVEVVLKYKVLDVLLPLAKSGIKLPSQCILKVTKFVLSGIAVSDTDTVLSEDSLSESMVEQLTYIISLPFEDVSMKNYLKLLTTNEAVFFLVFLMRALQVCSSALIDPADIHPTLKELNANNTLTEKIVMNWIDAVLSSHLLSFMVSPKLFCVISNLKKTIFKQKKYYRDIASLSPYMNYLQKQYKLPAKTIGKYAFETITI